MYDKAGYSRKAPAMIRYDSANGGTCLNQLRHKSEPTSAYSLRAKAEGAVLVSKVTPRSIHNPLARQAISSYL